MSECCDYFFPGPIIVNKLDSTFQASKDVPDEETPILKKEYVPYFLNPFHLSNAAFMMSYFNVGLAMNFLATPVSYERTILVKLFRCCDAACATVRAVTTSWQYALPNVTTIEILPAPPNIRTVR